MPKIAYVQKRFSPGVAKTISQAVTILEEYAAQGFVLTLRQLYYQFVARGLLPNRQREYNRLSTVISDARLAGVVDWDHLIDRTRHLESLQHFASAADALQKLASWYHIDFWERQKYRPEVWIEKDALVGVIEGVCRELDVPYLSCRGYTSQSEIWRAARRLDRWRKNKQKVFILHFGDHDPSGRDMSRDITARLDLMMNMPFEFERLALNMDQIERYGPPPNPTKLTDSRAGGYVAEFGHECWELDALEPAVIADLIRTQVLELRDETVYEEDLARKERVRDRLQELAGEWAE